MAVEANVKNMTVKDRSFQGYDSIKTKEQMVDLTGVIPETFNLLMYLLPDEKANSNTKKENKQLLMFLIKFKNGLTFRAISIYFAVHDTTKQH